VHRDADCYVLGLAFRQAAGTPGPVRRDGPNVVGLSSKAKRNTGVTFEKLAGVFE